MPVCFHKSLSGPWSPILLEWVLRGILAVQSFKKYTLPEEVVQ
jgi:hypothetical protein